MGRLITTEEDEFAFILFSSCAFTRAGDACAFMEDAFPNKQQKSRPITASGLHLSRTFVTVCESASSRGNLKKKKHISLWSLALFWKYVELQESITLINPLMFF